MTIEQTRVRIRASVWQSLAESDLSLKQLPREELEELVALVTDAALVEVDADLSKTVGKLTSSPTETIAADLGDEEILWQGRPFLSLTEQYIITSERVRLISGLLGKDREDIELVRIQDFDQSQTLRERILNLGDISIHSHDRSHPEVVLNNIRDPQAVHEILRRAVLDARSRHRLTYREEM